MSDEINRSEMAEQFWEAFGARSRSLIDNERLMDACVGIMGTGGVGSLTGDKLCREGVGNFVLADNDIVEIENIRRSAHPAANLDMRKAASLAVQMVAINPYVKVEPLNCNLREVSDAELREIVNHCNVVVVAADDPAVHVRFNRLLHHQKEMVFPFVVRRGNVGEVIWSVPGETRCLECCADMVRRIRRGTVGRFPTVGVDFDFIANITCRVVLSRLLRGRRGEGLFPEAAGTDRNLLLVGCRRDFVFREMPEGLLSGTAPVATDQAGGQCPVCGHGRKKGA